MRARVRCRALAVRTASANLGLDRHSRDRLPRMLCAAASALLLVHAVASLNKNVAYAGPVEDLMHEATLGDARALFLLGHHYEQGSIVDYAPNAAREYYRLASLRGHGLAQYRLGLIHIAGVGTHVDLQEGLFWLELAKSQKEFDEAALLSEKLISSLDVELSADDAEAVRLRVESFVPLAGPATLPPIAGGKDPSAVVLSDLRAWIENLPDSDCGPVSHNEDDSGIHIRLYARESQQKLISAQVEDSAYELGADVQIIALEGKACEVRQLLTSLGTTSNVGTTVVVRGRSGGERDSFQEGDLMEIEITAQREDLHIAVDYFANDGSVLHLYPPQDRLVTQPLRQGRRLIIGDGPETGTTLEVAPPFGSDLLVVFASQRPLYSGPRSELESFGQYLRFLHRRLASTAPSDRIEAFQKVITTTPARRD